MNTYKHTGYYGTKGKEMEEFEAASAKRRKKILLAYLDAKVDEGDRDQLKSMMRKDLLDLQIDLDKPDEEEDLDLPEYPDIAKLVAGGSPAAAAAVGGAGGGGGGGGGGQHHGMMVCDCGHRSGRCAFPLPQDRYHLNGSCKWDCCNKNWSDPVCSAPAPAPAVAAAAAGGGVGGVKMPVSPLFASPIAAAAAAGNASPRHNGVCRCVCLHQRGDMAYPLNSLFFHSKQVMFWHMCVCVCVCDDDEKERKRDLQGAKKLIVSEATHTHIHSSVLINTF